MTGKADPSKTDLMYEISFNPKYIPVKASDSSVKTVTEGGQTKHILRVGTGHYNVALFYDLDELSKAVWDAIDGKKTVREITSGVQPDAKSSEPDYVSGALLFYAECGALVSAREESEKKRVRVVSSFMTEITLIWDSTKIFRAVHKVVRPILQGALFWASMAIVLAGIIVFTPRFTSIFSDAGNFQVLGSTVVGFLFYNFVILGPVIVIHEMSHGLTLMHYAGRTGEVGTGLFYFGPMFYVDATGYWSLPRRQRIMMMWAGNLSTLLIGSGIALFRLFVQIPDPLAKGLDVAAFWCFYSTLWNLAPAFETDGYHILADIVNIPSLRTDGFTYLKSALSRFLHLSPRRESEAEVARKKTLLAYAIFSIIAVGYVAFLSVRFTIYMARDVVFWIGQIGESIVSGQSLSMLAYAVGVVSAAYFAMTVTGYGVLVQSQIKRSLARGLHFEAVHDRDLSVFYYLPKTVSSSMVERLESKTRSQAKETTSNFTLDREGGLFEVNLRIGGASIAFSQLKAHLRRIEAGFSRNYDDLLRGSGRVIAEALAGNSTNLLRDMAEKVRPGDRNQVRSSLSEYLRRREEMVRYILGSTFSTVWTIEVPPYQQSELLESLLPQLFIEDLTTTDLFERLEDFKKQAVYGLDSLADLAVRQTAEREDAIAHPERYQIVTSFEPVRGRVVFIGRTERIENRLGQLGPLIVTQVWSGHLDNLLGDINLKLYSIIESLPKNLPDIKSLTDGEVRSLRRYLVGILALEPLLRELQSAKAAVISCKTNLRRLKAIFQPDRKTKIGLLESLLSLNTENLESTPYGLKETESQLKKIFSWITSLEAPILSEERDRDAFHLKRKKRLIRAHTATIPVSLALFGIFLLELGSSVSLASVVALIVLNLGFALAHAIIWNSSFRVKRYPTNGFLALLSPLYGIAQVLDSLVVGIRSLNPADFLAKKEEKEGTGENASIRPESVPQAQPRL